MGSRDSTADGTTFQGCCDDILSLDTEEVETWDGTLACKLKTLVFGGYSSP